MLELRMTKQVNNLDFLPSRMTKIDASHQMLGEKFNFVKKVDTSLDSFVFFF